MIAGERTPPKLIFGVLAIPIFGMGEVGLDSVMYSNELPHGIWRAEHSQVSIPSRNVNRSGRNTRRDVVFDE
jgi:hypothetical protein